MAKINKTNKNYNIKPIHNCSQILHFKINNLIKYLRPVILINKLMKIQ